MYLVCYCSQQSQFELISSEVSYLKSMNILVNHFMGAFSARLDRDKEQFMTRDDFNRLFSNARAVRNASAKLVQ
jgi:RhoGEF domain